MTPREMLNFVKQWSKVSDEEKRLVALKHAYRWAVKRVFNSEDGPNLLASIGEELPALVAITKTYNLGAAVAHPFLGIKKLWVKLPADVRFTGMDPVDTNDTRFIDGDSDTVANEQVATGHPVVYDVINFSQVRFSPALPIGAIIRADYFRMATDPGTPESGEDSSSELDEEPIIGEDLPDVFSDCIASKATSLCFNMIDDEREASWENRAISELNDALFIGRRTQSPKQTQPFRRQRRRFI